MDLFLFAWLFAFRDIYGDFLVKNVYGVSLCGNDLPFTEIWMIHGKDWWTYANCGNSF